MKRFDFPLERVRQWRREMAQLEEHKLRQLFSALSGIEDRLARLAAERAEAEDAVFTPTGADAEQLGRLDSFRGFIRAQAATIGREKARLETQIAAQRARLVEASRQFELLERLQRKALLAWRQAGAKEQEDLAAELFLARRKRLHRAEQPRGLLDPPV
jgi:flagellar biosynthesis chaperone FliJ